jgi:hypothetical protein
MQLTRTCGASDTASERVNPIIAFLLGLHAVAGDAGCHLCHSQQGCATYCPNELSPTASIAGLKRMTANGFLKRLYRRHG